jgi:hypothetical protein
VHEIRCHSVSVLVVTPMAAASWFSDSPRAARRFRMVRFMAFPIDFLRGSADAAPKVRFAPADGAATPEDG